MDNTLTHSMLRWYTDQITNIGSDVAVEDKEKIGMWQRFAVAERYVYARASRKTVVSTKP